MYSKIKERQKKFVEAMWPNAVMQLSSIVNLGNNVYQCKGVKIPATDSFTSEYNKLLGINRSQADVVQNASGDAGFRNFSNYINVANSMKQARDVLVFASPRSKEMVNIIPIVEEYITPQLFFDFADMMVEKCDSHFENMESTISRTPYVRLYFNRNNPNIVSFGKNEDFITDGFYMEWNPTCVSMGHYYTRLVCTNGQTEKVYRRGATVFSLNAENINRMIDGISSGRLLSGGTLEARLRKAINTRISLGEMSSLQSILLSAGVSTEQAEEIIPYERTLQMYREAGHNHSGERFMKGEGTIWDSYNKLTDFASHTQSFAQDDVRRGFIMQEAFRFLNKKPDIEDVEYVDLF